MGEWAPIISAAGTIFAILFSAVAVLRNKKHDDSGEGQSMGVIMTELGTIKRGVDDIRAEQREQTKFNQEIIKAVTVVEESTKQAHKRIDRVEVREKGA